MTDASNLINKYISMSDFSQNWCFYDEELKISRKDLNHILPLSKEYSSKIWNNHIHNEVSHFSLLNSYEKKALQLVKKEYNWQKDWNNSTYNNFSEYLNNNVMFIAEEKIIVFWSKVCSAETDWATFLKHWPNFLFEDEGVILLNTMNGHILLFTSDGLIYTGKSINHNIYL